MTEWLMVVITAVYVVATIVISVFNGMSAKAAKAQTEATKQQIDEMVRQYNETYRPLVTIRFENIRSGLLCFVIENIGFLEAKDISIKINEDFINNVERIDDNSRIREILNDSFFLSSHQRMFLPLGVQSQFSELAKVVARIEITYNGKFSERTEIDLSPYSSMLSYNSELEDISHCLKTIGEEEKRYHKSLFQLISKKGPQSMLVHYTGGTRKLEVFKTVCVNPGITIEKIAKLIRLSQEEVLSILRELECVDKMVKHVPCEEGKYNVKWYRET